MHLQRLLCQVPGRIPIAGVLTPKAALCGQLPQKDRGCWAGIPRHNQGGPASSQRAWHPVLRVTWSATLCSSPTESVPSTVDVYCLNCCNVWWFVMQKPVPGRAVLHCSMSPPFFLKTGACISLPCPPRKVLQLLCVPRSGSDSTIPGRNAGSSCWTTASRTQLGMLGGSGAGSQLLGPHRHSSEINTCTPHQCIVLLFFLYMGVSADTPFPSDIQEALRLPCICTPREAPLLCATGTRGLSSQPAASRPPAP